MYLNERLESWHHMDFALLFTTTHYACTLPYINVILHESIWIQMSKFLFCYLLLYCNAGLSLYLWTSYEMIITSAGCLGTFVNIYVLQCQMNGVNGGIYLNSWLCDDNHITAFLNSVDKFRAILACLIATDHVLKDLLSSVVVNLSIYV